MHPTPSRRLGLLAVVVTAVLWGTTGTAATFAPDVGPLAIGAAALGIGGLLQAAVAVRPIQRAQPALAARWPLVLVGGIAVAVYPLAFYTAMHTAGVAIGSVVSLASAPVASGVLERVVDRRPLGARWGTAVVIGVVGSTALCLSGTASSDPGTGNGTDPGGTVAGIALGLVAGATYALYSWTAHRLMTRSVPRAAAMGAVFGTGGLLLLPVLLLTGAPLLATPTNTAVGLYMALVPMAAGYLLFGIGLESVPPSTATTVTLLEPAVATVLAVTVVGERLAPAGWVGLALVGVALVVLVAAPARSTVRGPGNAPTPPLS